MDKIEQIIAKKFQKMGIQYTIEYMRPSDMDGTQHDCMHIEFIKGDLRISGYCTDPNDDSPNKMEIADVKSRLTGNYQNIHGDKTAQETILLGGLFALVCRRLCDMSEISLDDFCLALAGRTYSGNESYNSRLRKLYDGCVDDYNIVMDMIGRDKVEEFAELHRQCVKLYTPPLVKSILVDGWRKRLDWSISTATV